MGLLDHFFGPPTKDKFAQQVTRTLRAVGDVRLATYDQQRFRLLLTEDGKDAGLVSLQNLYTEFSAMPADQRTGWLKKICIGFLSHLKDIPEEFEDVKPDLRPTLRPRSFVEYMRMSVDLEGGKEVDVPGIVISDHLMACVVYDLPNTMRFVTPDDLETWGVTLYEAMEAARQNLAEIPFPMIQLGEGLYVIETGDAYDAARLLLLDVMRGLNVVGQPVAMAVTRNCLLLTGSEDVDGLGVMAQLAEKKMTEPRRLCSYPVQLVGDEWEAWLPPEDHPHFAAFKKMALAYLGGEYADQKEQLDKLHEKQGVDVFVASFGVISKDEREFSYCTWSKDVPSWLPETDVVALYDHDTENADLVPWEAMRRIVGDAMTPLDCYPPRWSVGEFPTEEQMQQLRAVAM